MNSRSIMAAWIGLVSNVILTLFKLIVGILCKSQVLIADGIHNAGDIVASLVTFGSMKVSNVPPDEDHPYGHGKAEVLGSYFVAGVLALAGLFMLYHSFESLFHPAKQVFFLSFVIALVSWIWKYGLYVYTMEIGQKEKSTALIATANDHLADVYASIAATVGIGLGIIGDIYGIHWLMYGDPVAGIIVSFFVLKLAYEMGTEAIHVLMERNVEEEQMEQYKKSIFSISDVKRIDRIRAREHGHYVLVDVRLSIPGEYTIQQGHDICREIKKTVMEHHKEVDEVLIHLNPWYNE